jgi:UPF0716 protein FxsA
MRFVVVALLVLLAWAYAEVSLLAYVAQRIGTLWALLLMFMMAAAGAVIARAQGWRLLVRVRHEWRQRGMPVTALLDGVLIFLAGILLLVPGFLSDAVGLLLLVPFVRRLLIWWITTRWRRRTHPAGESRVTIIEGEIVPDDETGP